MALDRPQVVIPTPAQHRALRACMVCSIVQLQSQFRTDGCPNCEAFLQLARNDDAIQDCTSQVFEGLVTLAKPETSWVAKWQRLDGYVPGNYAIKVVGVLPEDYVSAVEENGVKRDGSNIEDQAPA
ncbi:MAG: hypothetical protein Q9162_004478 [Coniocarpon cinnabarinum]